MLIGPLYPQTQHAPPIGLPEFSTNSPAPSLLRTPMNKFLHLSAERRRDACLEVYQAMQLDAASVEKDFWVCWTLRELFALPGLT